MGIRTVGVVVAGVLALAGLGLTGCTATATNPDATVSAETDASKVRNAYVELSGDEEARSLPDDDPALQSLVRETRTLCATFDASPWQTGNFESWLTTRIMQIKDKKTAVRSVRIATATFCPEYADKAESVFEDYGWG